MKCVFGISCVCVIFSDCMVYNNLSDLALSKKKKVCKVKK